MKKLMPYGSANFEEIATENYYYIDKTMFIEKLENVKFPVFLRPRRFGKSLFTETLRCYYDIKLKDRFNEIFGKLYIGKNPTGNQNKYFFLSLNFSGMDLLSEMTEQELKNKFDRAIISKLIRFLEHYRDLLNIDDKYINDFFHNYLNDCTKAVELILSKVSGLGKKVYIIIDEYDSLTNSLAIRYRYSTNEDNMYLKILQKGGFFRSFFEMLKTETQSSIQQIYITGILPITISDMNSGFNIATWIHFDQDFANMLGITKTEFDNFIDQVYEDYEITLDKQEVKKLIKEYYNGYKFLQNSEEVYNPMMTLFILNHIIKYNKYPDELADYNLKVSYEQIAFLFGQNTENANQIITQITENKQYSISSTLRIAFDMKDFKEGTYIVEGLYYSGILTYSNILDTLKIPNVVTYTFALDYFNKLQNFKYDNMLITKWIIAYKQRSEVETLIAGFFKDVIQKFPGIFFTNVNESFYHGLFFHVLYNNTQKDIYEVLPEYNLPQGRVDVMVRTHQHPMLPRPINDLFEFKQVAKTETDEVFQHKFEEGIQQIKKYKTGDYANYRTIVVCFRGNLDYKIEVEN